MGKIDFIPLLEQIHNDCCPKTYFGGKQLDTYFDSDVCDLQLAFLILLGYFDVFQDDVPKDDTDISILLHKNGDNQTLLNIWSSINPSLHPDFSKWMNMVFESHLLKYRSEKYNKLLYEWVNDKLLFHSVFPDENPAIQKDFLLDLLDGTEEVMEIDHNKKKLLVIGNEPLYYRRVFMGQVHFDTCVLCPEDQYFYACSLINDLFFKNQGSNSKIQIIKRNNISTEAFPYEEARFDTIYSFAEAYVFQDKELKNSLDIKSVLPLLEPKGVAYVFSQDYEHLIPHDLFKSYDIPFVASYISPRGGLLYVCRNATPKNQVRKYNVYDYGDRHYFYYSYDKILAEAIQIVNSHGYSFLYQELTKEDFLYNSINHVFRSPDQLNFVYRDIDELLIRHTNDQVIAKEIPGNEIVSQSDFGNNPFNITLSPKFYQESDIFDESFSIKVKENYFKMEKDERMSKALSDLLYTSKQYDNKKWNDIVYGDADKERFLIECRVMTTPGLLFNHMNYSFIRTNASIKHPVCYNYCMITPDGGCVSDIDEVTVSPEYDEDFIIYQICKSTGKEHILVAPTKEEQHAYYLKKKEEYLLKNADLINEVRDEERRRISIDLHYLKHDAAQYLSKISSAKSLFEGRLSNGTLTLTDEFRSGNTVKDYLDDIGKCINHVTSFLEQMTYLTDVLPQKPTDISQILQELVENTLNTKKYDVLLEMSESIKGTKCLLDERIHKAFDNILSNAERHAFNRDRKGYKLIINADKEGDVVIITFSNNGTPPDGTLTEEGFFTRGLHVGPTGHSGFGGSIIRETIEAQNGIVHLHLNENSDYPFQLEIKLPVYYD